MMRRCSDGNDQQNPRLKRGFCLLLLGALLLPLACGAAPYKPAGDAQVLERLPTGVSGQLLRGARERVRDPQAAAFLARTYIERARRESDPRDLGYAQGLLQPWWNQASPPLPVLLLRATLRQSRHDFNGALRDLDLFLQKSPADAQALLTHATVLRVLGRYSEAADSCRYLQGLADGFIVELCRLPVTGLSGQLPQSYAALLKLREGSAAQPVGIRTWMLAELGDMAERLGKVAQAESYYREALAQDEDHGLRAAYADLLLDSGRAAEVLPLVADYERVDALQFRHALALKALHDPAYAVLAAKIAAAHASARLRNDDLHLREEARYLLEVRGDAAAALPLAQANWNLQHEPWDARLLLQAAQALGRPAAAQPVLDWLKDAGMQDVRLQPYMKQGRP